LRLSTFNKEFYDDDGIPLMPVVYQVVGFGRGDGRHSDRYRRSVV